LGLLKTSHEGLWTPFRNVLQSPKNEIDNNMSATDFYRKIK